MVAINFLAPMLSRTDTTPMKRKGMSPHLGTEWASLLSLLAKIKRGTEWAFVAASAHEVQGKGHF